MYCNWDDTTAASFIAVNRRSLFISAGFNFGSILFPFFFPSSSFIAKSFDFGCLSLSSSHTSSWFFFALPVIRKIFKFKPNKNLKLKLEKHKIVYVFAKLFNFLQNNGQYKGIRGLEKSNGKKYHQTQKKWDWIWSSNLAFISFGVIKHPMNQIVFNLCERKLWYFLTYVRTLLRMLTYGVYCTLYSENEILVFGRKKSCKKSKYFLFEWLKLHDVAMHDVFTLR